MALLRFEVAVGRRFQSVSMRRNRWLAERQFPFLFAYIACAEAIYEKGDFDLRRLIQKQKRHVNERESVKTPPRSGPVRLSASAHRLRIDCLTRHRSYTEHAGDNGEVHGPFFDGHGMADSNKNSDV